MSAAPARPNARKPATGRRCGRVRARPPDAQLQEIELNGAPAIALCSHGRPFVIIMIEISKGRIHRILAIANPDKLGALEASLRRGSDPFHTVSRTALH